MAKYCFTHPECFVNVNYEYILYNCNYIYMHINFKCDYICYDKGRALTHFNSYPMPLFPPQAFLFFK